MDGHWKPIIVWYLKDESLRFKELLALLPDISTKVLTDQLKELEADKIVNRDVYNELPPRVEYHLTKYGRTLLPALKVLRQWGLVHLKLNRSILHKDSPWQQKLPAPGRRSIKISK